MLTRGRTSLGFYSWSVRVRCPVSINLAELGGLYYRAEERKEEGVQEGVKLGKVFVAIVGDRNERDPVRLIVGSEMWDKKKVQQIHHTRTDRSRRVR